MKRKEKQEIWEKIVGDDCIILGGRWRRIREVERGKNKGGESAAFSEVKGIKRYCKGKDLSWNQCG